MAIGDAATAAGLPLVPESGEEGLVKHGAREINRTRDHVAGVKALIPASKTAYRTAIGLTMGTTLPDPATLAEDDIFLLVIVP